jgi:hypothetical protein
LSGSAAARGSRLALAPGSGRDSWLELLQGRGSLGEGAGDGLVPVQAVAVDMQLAGALLAAVVTGSICGGRTRGYCACNPRRDEFDYGGWSLPVRAVYPGSQPADGRTSL